jgi:hypothetical protein
MLFLKVTSQTSVNNQYKNPNVCNNMIWEVILKECLKLIPWLTDKRNCSLHNRLADMLISFRNAWIQAIPYYSTIFPGAAAVPFGILTFCTVNRKSCVDKSCAFRAHGENGWAEEYPPESTPIQIQTRIKLTQSTYENRPLTLS